jgi:hypothetical protein
VALPATRRPRAVGAALVALACAVGVALHDGAAPALAPLWGAGLLIAGGLAERALILPAAGEIEVGALVTWIAGLSAVGTAGLAGAAVVLLAAGTPLGSSAIGLAAAALLALIPAALARRLSPPP